MKKHKMTKQKKVAKRPTNTIKFVEKDSTSKVFVVQVPELVPLPKERKKEEWAVLASEEVTPGQHNNMPKQTVETNDKEKGVGKPSARMKIGGR